MARSSRTLPFLPNPPLFSSPYEGEEREEIQSGSRLKCSFPFLPSFFMMCIFSLPPSMFARENAATKLPRRDLFFFPLLFSPVFFLFSFLSHPWGEQREGREKLTGPALFSYPPLPPLFSFGDNLAIGENQIIQDPLFSSVFPFLPFCKFSPFLASQTARLSE